MECYIYFIPLKKHPVFKIGNTLDLPGRMKNMGIYKHADHRKIVAITLPDKQTALMLEKSIGRMLRPYNTQQDLPADILNGRTEFFRIDAWGHALDLVSNLRKYGWEFKIEFWSKCLEKARPPKVVKMASPKVLAARFKKERELKIWERYNRMVYSRFWINRFKSVEKDLIGLRFATQAEELHGYHQEVLEFLADLDKDMSLSPEEKRFVRGLYLSGLDDPCRRWLLVYKDEDQSICRSFFNPTLERNGVFISAPTVKMNGGSSLFAGALSADGISVLDVNIEGVGYPGTEPLIALLRGYNTDFKPTLKPWGG